MRYVIYVRHGYLGCSAVHPHYFDSLCEAIRFQIYYASSYMRFESGIIRVNVEPKGNV